VNGGGARVQRSSAGRILLFSGGGGGLDRGMEKEREFDEKWLRGVLEEFGCETGTLHRTGESGDLLELVVQVGVPEVLMPKITRIPFGKGIAGAAAESRGPVELCNLQQDLGGVAKPDARKTGVSGSLAVPVMAEDGRVLGTLGIGMREPHVFGEEEKERLAEVARGVAGEWE